LQEIEALAKGATNQDLAAITRKYLYDPKKGSYVDAVHQINSTYYSACEEDDLTYLLARAIQFFCPGIPLVYYVGMLAGRNDAEAVKRTGVGRNINRRNYSYEDAADQVGYDALIVKHVGRLYRSFIADWAWLQRCEDPYCGSGCLGIEEQLDVRFRFAGKAQRP
jgi:hypothetical protein